MGNARVDARCRQVEDHAHVVGWLWHGAERRHDKPATSKWAAHMGTREHARLHVYAHVCVDAGCVPPRGRVVGHEPRPPAAAVPQVGPVAQQRR